MSLFEKTYQLVRDAPPAMGWEEYERNARAQWDYLISGERANHEPAIHEFLEQNPSFVPGAFSFPTSGHAPEYGGVFSKPLLTGVGFRVPDFMWLATATDIIYPVLIEIETPAKRWFTESRQPSAKFTQARNQLVEWKQWLNKPANRLSFMEVYGITAKSTHFDIRPKFVLVYGRRSEFDESPELRGIRAQQQGDEEHHVTFDRLAPDHNARNYLTLKKEGEHVVAMVIPPTVCLGPQIAPSWVSVRYRPEAALREERMSPERRRFLAERFPYWDEWAGNDTRVFQTGDWE